MLKEGQLLFYNPFYFKDGGQSKPKFFIILKSMNNEVVIASLPTSKNNAPTLIDSTHGCINIDERLINCYVFEPKRSICKNGFCFDVHTYVYGDKASDYSMNSLIDGQNYQLKGELNQEEFEALKNCIVNSDATARKIRRLLAS